VKLWNRLLIFLHLRPDWDNPDLTPPAFDSAPHTYDPYIDGKTLTYCAACGGGRLHAIHTKPITPASDPHRPPMVDRSGKPGPWGQIYARSLEDEQRRTDATQR